MRKIALLSIVLVATVITVISCQKNKHFNDGTNPAHSPGKYQTKDGEMSIGAIEKAGVEIFISKYGFAQNLTFSEVDSLTHEIVDSLLGTNMNQQATTETILDWVQSNGYLDSYDHFKHPDTALMLMTLNESDSDLRNIYQDIMLHRDTTSVFITWMSQQINGFTSPDFNTNFRAQAFREIYEYSDGLVYMGQNLPDDVAAADAMGFNDGDMYARATNGGRALFPDESYNGLTPNLYWAMRFAISYSNYVACHSMHAAWQ